MAHRIKRHGGKCCTCEQEAAPCECEVCEGTLVAYMEVPPSRGLEMYVGPLRICTTREPIALIYQCQQRGGTASLIGFPEFAAPSAPPLRYLRKVSAGSATSVSYTGLCAVETGIVTCSYDWQCEYSAVTGALTSSGSVNCTDTDPQPPSCAQVLAPACDVWVSQTQTHQQWVLTHACCPITAGTMHTTATDRTLDLSVQDTESNAINRLLATVEGGTWGPWMTAGLPPMFCPAETCCRNVYVARTGVTFGYGELRWRVAPAGQLVAPGCYCIEAPYLARVPGGGTGWTEVAYDVVKVEVLPDGTAVMRDPD